MLALRLTIKKQTKNTSALDLPCVIYISLLTIFFLARRGCKRQNAAKSALDLPRVKVGVPYTDFNHYIFSTWQSDWNGAVANKLYSVKPVLGVLQAVPEGYWLVSCPHRSQGLHIWGKIPQLVWALSMYSDSSSNFGGVQSFCWKKERYIW